MVLFILGGRRAMLSTTQLLYTLKLVWRVTPPGSASCHVCSRTAAVDPLWILIVNPERSGYHLAMCARGKKYLGPPKIA